MTSDDMERAIEFLLQSQAKHDAQIGELREMVAETNQVVAKLAASQSEFNEMITRTVTDLAAAQQQTQTQLRETDARLDRLAATVERLIEGRGDS